MKLLIIAPGIDGGGVGAVIYKYISHMNLKKMTVDLVVQDYGHKHMLHDAIENLGVNIYYFPKRSDNFAKMILLFVKLMKENKYDIVHCHSQNWSPLYLTIAKLCGVKTRIAHSHLTVQNENRIKIKCLNLLKPYLRFIATDYFACGRDAGRYMWGDKVVESGKLHTMNNAVEIEKFRFNKDLRNKKRAELGITTELVVGHVGRFDQQKNHRFLAEVFAEYKKRNPSAKLILVGMGPLEKQIHKIINDFGVANDVMFLGSRNDVHELLNAMDIFLLPSLYEGLPVVGVEAQANGLPFLFSDSITDEVCLLPTSCQLSLKKSKTEWAEQMEKSLMIETDRMLASEIVTARGFNISVEATKMQEFYEQKAEKKEGET